MNRSQMIGAGLLGATVLAIGGSMILGIGEKPAEKALETPAFGSGTNLTLTDNRTNASVAAVGNVINVTPSQAQPAAANDPASQPAPLRVGPGPGPVVQSQTVFRPFKCVNQHTRATVFELGRARNAQYMGQRNNRSFWKVDTPTRTVTFNTDVRDINCAFTA